MLRLPLPHVPRKIPEAERWLVQRLKALGAWAMVKRVCSEHRETVELAVFSDLRYPTTVRARRAVWALLYNPPYNLKLGEIARMFGRSETTVRTALRRAEQEKEASGTFVKEDGEYVRKAQ